MKQKNARDGLLKKVRERQEGYKKPGVKRREKKEEGIKNYVVNVHTCNYPALGSCRNFL